MPRLALALLLAAGLTGCISYEYEHEFWLRVDGSGRVHVTGRPEFWAAFKDLADPAAAGGPLGGASIMATDPATLRDAARALFERSGLRVRRVTVTERAGRRYLFVAADFDDVNRLQGSAAFPDLRISLTRAGERLRLEGQWRVPPGAPGVIGQDEKGLMAVRFHMPSKIYEHKNAFAGVERGNIIGWRQEMRQAVRGGTLDFGATLDRRSILWSTVGLFAGAIALALAILGGVLAALVVKGRKHREPKHSPTE